MTEHQDIYKGAAKWPQIIAAFAACLGSFGCGAALAWTSPALPHIDEDLCVPNDDCDITGVSHAAAGWIGALLPLGALASGPVTGYLMNKIGRRRTMISYSVIMALGYILFILAYEIKDDISIYFGRFFTGFAGGSFCLSAPLYIVEIAEPSMKGALASMMQLMITMGIAFTDGLNINDALHWNVISAICIFIPIAMAVAMIFMPESPFYLAYTKDFEETEKALKWLRGKNHDIGHEMEELFEQVRIESERGSISVKDLLSKKVYLKPFLIVLVLMFLQQFSGINMVVFYTQEIFSDAGSTLDPTISSFIVGLAQVAGTLIAVLIVEKFGRRFLLALSDFFTCVSILALGVFFFLKEKHCDEEGNCDSDIVEDLGWLPLVSLMVYVVFFNIGFGPLPWAVNAEIFSEEAKSLASSVAFCFNWFCAFLVTKYLPSLAETDMKQSGTYFLFAAIGAFGTAFVIFIVPETKGKTGEEMKQVFDKSLADLKNAEANRPNDTHL